MRANEFRRVARMGLVSVSLLVLSAVLQALAPTPAAASCTLSSAVTWAVRADGDWANGFNWSPTTVPDSPSTNVCIVNGYAVTLDQYPVSVASVQIGPGYLRVRNTLNVFGPSLLGGFDVFGGTLNLRGDVTLAGTVSMFGGSVEGGGHTLTVDGAIGGAGSIGGSSALKIVNQGTISATGVLNLNGGNGGVTNTGTLQAMDGGALILNNTISNTGGSITTGRFGLNGTVQIGGTINGGTLSSNALFGLMQSIGSGATLNDVTISPGSVYTAGGGTTTQLNGAIVNGSNSLFKIDGGGGSDAIVNLGSNVRLSGGGYVEMTVASAFGAGSAFVRGNGVTLTNVDNTISASGFIGDNAPLAFVNAGTLLVPSFSFGAQGPATLNVGAGGGSFLNNGAVEVGGTLTVVGDSNGFNQTQGASGSPVTQVDGTLNVPNGFNLRAGVLGGTGTVVGNVNNTGGAVAPGAGTLTINGNYTQRPSGVLDVLLAGTTAGAYSQLDAAGAASLDGALDITTQNFFSTAVGDVFTIMLFASSTGNFSTFELNGRSCSFSSYVLTCPNGVFTEEFVAGDTMLNLVVDIAGAPIVPEPPTWAMLLIGFTGLGFAGWRSSRNGGGRRVITGLPN
jgi:hypothetical protein